MGPIVRREVSSRNKGANILNYVKGISETYTDVNIHLLAKIVTGPPELPIPPEPVYHPYELLRLTFPDGMNDLKLQADKDSQALKLLNQANQSRIEKSNGDRLTLQNELQSVGERLAEKAEQVKKLSEQINKLNSELTKAKQQAKTAESKAAELLASVNALRSEKNRQEESTAIDRTGEKDKLKEIIETLREENQVLKRKLEELYLESSRKPKSVPQVTPSSDSRSAASVREQVLCTEVVRLRQELMQTRQTAEARIRSLRQRLTVVSEEMFLRQAKENQVAQIHMAGIAYADQYPEVNSSVVTNLPQTGLRQVYMENWNKTGHPSERISLLPPLKPP